MTRRRRTVAAWFTAFALVFAQLAVSAHACALADRAAMSHAAAAHPEGCPDMNKSADVCSQHCEYGNASVDAAKPLPAIDTAAGPLVAVLSAPRVSGPGLAVLSVFLPAHGPPPEARPLPLRI
jgi:hypothetical protein